MIAVDLTTDLDLHPLEAAGLGAPPYRFDGYEKSIYQSVPGDPHCPIQPGSSCDYCANGIMHVFWFRDSGGRRFKLGCDCAEKGRVATGKAWKELKAMMYFERRSHELSAKRQAREAAEREENESKGLGALTHAEIREKGRKAAAERAEAERQAELKIQRDSRHVGTVGVREEFTATVEWTYRLEGFRSWDIGPLMSRLRTPQGDCIMFKTTGTPLGRVGDKVRFKATVKSHETYEEQEQTWVTRAKVTEVIFRAPSE